MLSSFRNLANSWVSKVLLGLLAMAFVGWGVFTTSASSEMFSYILSATGWGPKDLAKVGAITINGDDYSRSLQRRVKEVAQQTGQPLTMDDAHKFGLDRQVLDGMVSQAAVDTTARNLKLAVSQNVLLGEIAREKAFQNSSGQFDSTAFQRVLENNGMNEAQYFAMQTRQHAQAAILDVASGQLTMPKVLTTALTQYTGETRDVKYFDVTATDADVTKPTDDELKKQYDAHPAAYTAPEYRAAATMSVDAAAIAVSQQISPEELQAGYDAHKQDFATPEKRTIIQLTFPSVDEAKKAKDRIAAGEDIMKIAGEMKLKDSDVTLTDKLKEDFLDPKIADAAFALKEGEVSDPVQGSLATALVKASKVTPAHQATLDEVKDQLTKTLQLEKAKTQIGELYNNVEDARAASTKFEDIAQKFGLTFAVVGPVSAAGQDQAGKDLSASVKPDVLKAIFASDVGVENDAVNQGDGYVWYEVRSVTPSALKPMDQVKDQVSQDIIHERISVAALDKAKKIVDVMKAGKSMEDEAKELSALPKIAQNLKRDQQTPDFDGPALSAAFSVADQGFAVSPGGDGKSARVMQVIKLTMPAVMASSPELTQMKQQLASTFSSDMQQGLVNALKKNVGVKVNADLWRQDTGGDVPVLTE